MKIINKDNNRKKLKKTRELLEEAILWILQSLNLLLKSLKLPLSVKESLMTLACTLTKKQGVEYSTCVTWEGKFDDTSHSTGN